MLKFYFTNIITVLVFANASGYIRVDLQKPSNNIYLHSQSRIGSNRMNISKIKNSYLLPNDEVQSEEDSRVNLWLKPRGPGYFQGSHTISKFLPSNKCQFKVKSKNSGLIYLMNESNGKIRPPIPCMTITEFSIIEPKKTTTAFFVFLKEDKKTYVGALTNSIKGNLKITSQRTKNSINIKAGQLVSISSEGDIKLDGEFRLKEFYKDFSLSLGLGPSKEDEEYIKEQPEEIQKIITDVRVQTLLAMRIQENEIEQNTDFLEELPIPPDDYF